MEWTLPQKERKEEERLCVQKINFEWIKVRINLKVLILV